MLPYLRSVLPIHRVDRSRHRTHAGRRVHLHQRVVVVVMRGSGLGGGLGGGSGLRASRVVLRAHVRRGRSVVVTLAVNGAVIGGQVGVVMAAVVGVRPVGRRVVDLHRAAAAVVASESCARRTCTREQLGIFGSQTCFSHFLNVGQEFRDFFPSLSPVSGFTSVES